MNELAASDKAINIISYTEIHLGYFCARALSYLPYTLLRPDCVFSFDILVYGGILPLRRYHGRLYRTLAYCYISDSLTACDSYDPPRYGNIFCGCDNVLYVLFTLS